MNKRMIFFQRSLIIFLAGIWLFGAQPVNALSDKQRNLYNSGQTPYYEIVEGCQNINNAMDSSVSVIGGGKIYESGLEPPYILEQWAIHTLKAIAQKQGIDESKTVTKEHVVALLAFAIGEGGDIANQWLFNPLNTGIYAPELIDGEHAGNGTQGFKSFDAGVEATARTMVGSNQNRLAKVLSDPDSSAKDFMEALTYYKRYKGNQLWAEASVPDPDGYYASRLNLVRLVKSDYKEYASIIIGTPELEQAAGKRDPSKLTYTDGGGDIDSSGGSSGSSSNCNCSVGGSTSTDSAEGLRGEDNVEKSFNFFVDRDVSPVLAAGIVGNFMAESGESIDPNASNGTHEGIAQWDRPGRWAELLEYASKLEGDEKDKNPRSLFVQLKYALQEDDIKPYLETKPKNPSEAAELFEQIFERSGGSRVPERKAYAEDVFKKYGNNQGAASANSTNCESASGSAFIDGNYAWPVALSKSDSSAGYPLPCRQASCHHDQTPAFDLAHKDTVSAGDDGKSVGVAVYAIADGTIEKVDLYNNIPGCYDLQFKAKDGYVYWYGHIRSPVTEQAGKAYKVGEKIAEIGERKCTGNGSYPHLHIDRGSPKGSFGGMECCRDQGMIDIINGLYEKLP